MSLNYGFFKTACATLKLKVANPSYNKEEIKKAIIVAEKRGARLLVTPELSVTGYTCADLFLNSALLDASQKALEDLVLFTEGKSIVVAVGLPVRFENALYNCAVVLQNGKVLCAVPKNFTVNYGEFSEKRWFSNGVNKKGIVLLAGQKVPFGSCVLNIGNSVKIGFEIGEDLWSAVSPSSKLCLYGANIICNLSASNESIGKTEFWHKAVGVQSSKCLCAYAFASAGTGESTTDLYFGGNSFVYECGTLLCEGERYKDDTSVIFADADIEKINNERIKNTNFADFSNCADLTDVEEIYLPEQNVSQKYFDREVSSHPFLLSDEGELDKRCREIFEIQSGSLAKRLSHIGSKGCVVGISGGLDSTLALLVCVRAMQKIGKSAKDVLGITMPGFGTTDRTHDNAVELMKALGVSTREISIKDACIQHFKDIGHDKDVKDVTYENAQARERTQILFNVANKEGKIVVGTGDMSELAMGWCTYNGDHMSMYGVNASVTKTLVRRIVKYISKMADEKCRLILEDVLDTPVSPELLPPDENGKILQKTEDKIGPYELHDFFLFYLLRYGFSAEKILFLAEKAFDGVYDKSVIEKWLRVFLRRFFVSQFKRSCAPDGAKIGTVGLSPKGDLKMASDVSFDDFLTFGGNEDEK